MFEHLPIGFLRVKTVRLFNTENGLENVRIINNNNMYSLNTRLNFIIFGIIPNQPTKHNLTATYYGYYKYVLVPIFIVFMGGDKLTPLTSIHGS